MKQLCADAARARIGKQHTAGFEQHQCQPVDVLVSARCTLGKLHGRCKFGWIQHDGVKCSAFFEELAQLRIDICINQGAAAGIKTVKRNIRSGLRQGRRRRIDRRNMPGSSSQSRYGKSAGIAVAVKNAGKTQSVRPLVEALAAVSLIQIKPSFVATSNVQLQLPAVLGNSDSGSVTTGQPTGNFRQSFQRPDAGIGALIKPFQASLGKQCLGQHFFPALYTAAGKLRHQGVGIAIHHQPWQAIGFAMHQSAAIALHIKPVSSADSYC